MFIVNIKNTWTASMMKSPELWSETLIPFRSHLLSTYAKFFEKQFLPPDRHTYVKITHVHTRKNLPWLKMLGYLNLLLKRTLKIFEEPINNLPPQKVTYNPTQNVEIGLLNSGVSYSRSSYQRCSVRKSVLRNFTKFTGKHLC